MNALLAIIMRVGALSVVGWGVHSFTGSAPLAAAAVAFTWVNLREVSV